MSKKNGVTCREIRINTQNVKKCANDLLTINRKLESDFNSVKSAMDMLAHNWDGSASSKAIPKFNKIKSEFCGPNGRKAVMDSYIKFLNNAVAVDYESTEQINTSLSELFK